MIYIYVLWEIKGRIDLPIYWGTLKECKERLKGIDGYIERVVDDGYSLSGVRVC